MNTWGIVDGRLSRMERDQNRKKAYKHFAQYDEQRAAPSCPPDYCIHIRGGWFTSGAGDQVPSPDLLVSWNPAASPPTPPSGTYLTHTTIGPWINAGYYKAQIICRLHQWDTTANLFGTAANVNSVYGSTANEWTTAECAERFADWMLRDAIDYYSGYPICIVIFKNDGITNAMDPGAYNHILPIDAANRGRSYIWRDIRPLIKIPYPTARITGTSPEPACT